MALALTAASVGAAALAADASASGLPQGPPAGPKSPPFTQCPAIGQDSSCEYLIDVTSRDPAVRPTVLQDPSQHFYDGEDDVTVAVQNDTSSPLGSVHIGVPGSGDRLFAFDGDGICWSGISPKPAECPFDSSVTYAGPDTALTPESDDAGTVFFDTPLEPGQYTYFSLESPPTQGMIVAGEVNDAVSTTLTNTETSQTGARLAAPKPVSITDRATIKGLGGAEATGTVEYILYSDPSCTKAVERLGKKNVERGVAAASDPSSSRLPTNRTYFWLAKYSGDRHNSPNWSACGSETMSFGAPPARPQPSSNGGFTLLALHVNKANGQIAVTVQLPAAGDLTARGVVKQGASLAGVGRGPTGIEQKRRCKRGFVSKHNRCTNNAPVLYGAASLSASTPGANTIVIRPTKRVREALRKGRKLDVTVSTTFQDRSGGAPLTRVKSALVRIKKPKHAKR